MESLYNENEIQRLARKSFSRVGLATLLCIALAYGLVSVLLVLPLGPVKETEAFLWLGNYIPIFGIAMPLSCLVLRHLPRQEREKCPLQMRDLFRYFAICCFAMYSSNFINNDLLMMISSAWGIEVARPIEEMVSETSMGWQLAIAVIIGPICEELFFRKIIIDRLVVFGEKPALVISALAFCLYHGNAEQYLYTLALGLVFSAVYIRKGNIIYSILLHMMVNFTGSIVPTFVLNHVNVELLENLDTTGLTMEETMGLLVSNGYTLYIVYVFAVLGLGAVGGAFFVKALRKRSWREAPLPLPKGKAFEICYCNAGMLLLTLGSFAMAGYTLWVYNTR